MVVGDWETNIYITSDISAKHVRITGDANAEHVYITNDTSGSFGFGYIKGCGPRQIRTVSQEIYVSHSSGLNTSAEHVYITNDIYAHNVYVTNPDALPPELRK